MSTMPMQLFVYGSLKQGFQFSHLMEGADFIGKAETVDRFVLVKHLGYPCLVRSDRPGINLGSFNPNHSLQTVRGEVYLIKDPQQLKVLDELEDVPNDYQREQIRVRLIDFQNKILEAETYVFQRASSLTDENAVILENGDWSMSENQPDNESYGSETIDPKFLKRN